MWRFCERIIFDQRRPLYESLRCISDSHQRALLSAVVSVILVTHANVVLRAGRQCVSRQAVGRQAGRRGIYVCVTASFGLATLRLADLPPDVPFAS